MGRFGQKSGVLPNARSWPLPWPHEDHAGLEVVDGPDDLSGASASPHRAKRKPGSGPGHRDTDVTRLCRIGVPAHITER